MVISGSEVGRPVMKPHGQKLGLDSLPTEITHEIQLFALSPSLPEVSRHIHHIFKTAPASYHALYILSRIVTTQGGPVGISDTLTRALRYPLCSQAVLEALFRRCRWTSACLTGIRKPELPRRLFRSLMPRTTFGGHPAQWNESDHPMPFLKCLYDLPTAPDPNSYEGYALTKAVHARFQPLVRFLLDRGASPNHKNQLAVMVAIHQKDVVLVKMLIEREAVPGPRNKRRRLPDRVKVNTKMLSAAVKCDAREIVEYLAGEKGCVPSLQTIRSLR